MALPADIILTIDNSGSMKKNDPLFLTRDTVASFIAGLDQQHHAGLLLFGTQARLINGLASPLNLTRAVKDTALTKIDYRDQWTDTAAALEMALYEHKMNGRPEAESIIILLTDGIVDTGNQEDSKRRREWIIGGLAQQAKQAGVRIFGIAFTQAADFELLQLLAQGTGGDYYRILAATDMEAVFGKIKTQISASIGAGQPAVELEDSFDALAEFAIDFADTDPSVTPEAGDANQASGATASQSSNLAIAEPSSAPAEIPVFSGRGNGRASDNELTETNPDPRENNPADNPPLPAQANTGMAVYLIWFVVPILLILGGVWYWSRTIKIDRHAPEALLHDLDKISGAATVDVTGRQTRIGRVPGASHWWDRPQLLVLNNVGISRLHAIIEYREDGYWLVDQNSKNGCMVNHERSRLPRRLQSGDKLHIAKLEFIFELPHPDEPDETVLFGQ